MHHSAQVIVSFDEYLVIVMANHFRYAVWIMNESERLLWAAHHQCDDPTYLSNHPFDCCRCFQSVKTAIDFVVGKVISYSTFVTNFRLHFSMHHEYFLHCKRIDVLAVDSKCHVMFAFAHKWLNCLVLCASMLYTHRR